ncbi:MAG: RNA polymerase sigma factor [Oscillospiraceae bacterium]
MAEDIGRLYDKIYRYCFYKVRCSECAEDITQEAFLRYFARSGDIRNDRDAAYLFTIAKNLCADHFRGRRWEELTDDQVSEGFADVSDTKVAVRAALEKLDERRREVLVMRYIAEMSVSETAEMIGISRYAVYRLESTALAEMKKHLKGAMK